MKKCVRHLWNEWKGELLLTALFVPLFLLLMDTGYLNDTDVIAGGTLAALVGTAAVGIVLALKKKLSWERMVFLMILAGIFMRVGYVLGTHTYIRHHDYGDIQWYVYGYSEDLNVHDFGHAPYVMYMYLNRQLPHFNQGQFYHPPLYHILAAFFMWLTYKILKIQDLIYLLEAAQIVSCLASCYTLLMVPKILNALQIRGSGKALTTGVMAFLPMFYLMASWVNNDALVFYFMTWIVLYTIRWYRNTSWGNTLMLALGFGLGMMSKASCALLAFFTGAVMLVKLIDVWRQSGEKRTSVVSGLFLRFLGFGAVAFPLGLFFPIRNLIKFGQPLNYVLRLNIPGVPKSGFVQRYLTFPFSRLFNPIFAEADEYNLNLFLIKTASFGEFQYVDSLKPWAAAILGANLILVVLALAAAVLVWKREKNLFWRWGFPGVWILLYGSAVLFTWQYPFPCSMDARYVTPTILLGALYLGKAMELPDKGWLRKGYKGLCMLALGVLAIAGCAMFLNAGPYVV